MIINKQRWLSIEDLPNERWKDIDGFVGRYQISDYGRVKSLEKTNRANGRVFPERILKQHSDKDGYLLCRIYKDGDCKTIRVHQLVGKYFVPNVNNEPIFDHIIEVEPGYCNNHYTNLTPISYSDNILKAYKSGRKIRKNQYLNKKGKENPFSKEISQYDMERNIIKVWDCIMDIERALGYNHSRISAHCLNKTKTKEYKGFIWEYKSKKEGD